MIQPNELRKENCIQFKDEKGAYFYSRVKELHESYIIGSVLYYDKPYVIATYDKAEPIPLTPELLGKAGFEKSSIAYSWCKNDLQLVFVGDSNCSIYLWTDRMEYSIIPNAKTKYLHQLQNLYFALTGEELTFTLTPHHSPPH